MQGHGTKREAHVVQGEVIFCDVVGSLMRVPWVTGAEWSRWKSHNSITASALSYEVMLVGTATSESLELIEIVSIDLTPNLPGRAAPTTAGQTDWTDSCLQRGGLHRLCLLFPFDTWRNLPSTSHSGLTGTNPILTGLI